MHYQHILATLVLFFPFMGQANEPRITETAQYNANNINYFDMQPDEIIRLIADKLGEHMVRDANMVYLSFLHNCTPFLLTCKRFNKLGKDEFVKHLAEKYAVSPPIHAATILNNASYVHTILEKDKNSINAYMYYRKPLHTAAAYNADNVAGILLTHGADVNEKTDAEKYTPLHFAAIYNRPQMARFLLKNGATIDEECGYGGTPLYVAFDNRSYAVAELLLQHGAQNKQTRSGSDVFEVAKGWRDQKLLDLLTKYEPTK